MTKRSALGAPALRLAALVLALIVLEAGAGEPDLAWLRDTRFMAYTPSEFRVVHGTPVAPSPASIAADLQTLRPYVDGLITYSAASGLAEVPQLAKRAGFRAVILGVWSPADGAELSAALSQARRYPELVRAIVVGNEGLYWERYGRRDLEQAMDRIRREVPQVAVTTSEPFAVYLDSAAPACEGQDFLLPNVHPIFEPWFRPGALTQAAEFVVAVARRLHARCNKFVLVKETGVPSGPDAAGFSPAVQRAFWRELLPKMQAESDAAAALFEAFDAPWKIEEIRRDSGERDPREAAWGWFTADRSAKAVVDVLTPLAPPAAEAGIGARQARRAAGIEAPDQAGEAHQDR